MGNRATWRGLGAAMVALCCMAGAVLPGRAAGGTQEVEAAMQEYARLERAMDSAGLSGSYTPDGELLEPGMEPIQGPAAIRKFLDSFSGARMESASMTTGHIDTWDHDALQWGSYAQRVAPPGKPAADYHGRFVAQWSRQPGGRWLIRRLMVQPA